MITDKLFLRVEKFKQPPTILWRSIELELLKQRLGDKLQAKTVLDLGCGKGIVAGAVLEGKVSYGLDNNERAIKLAKKSGIYRRMILANARKIPLGDKSVDLVFSNCVIEHIKDLDSVLNEIKRILKIDGYFVFTAPNNNFKNYRIFSYLNLTWLAKFYGRLRDKKYHHYHCYSLKKWAEILEKKSFKLIDGYYYLDQKTTEFWDLLLTFFFIPNKISQKLSRWVYKKYFREKIYKYFLKAKAVKKGAAVCLIAKKMINLNLIIFFKILKFLGSSQPPNFFNNSNLHFFTLIKQALV